MAQIAKAHSRPGVDYAGFHLKLLEDPRNNYALKHLYSVENTKYILEEKGWSQKEIEDSVKHITIDVWAYVVRIHCPKWIPVPISEQRNYSVLQGCKVINCELYRPIKGISQLISKREFVDALIDRTMAKAAPQNLLTTDEWNILNYKGSEFYQLICNSDHIECNCKAYRGISKAFMQDAIALKHLQNHPILEGQIPDKHCFSVWQFLKCHSLDSYRYARDEWEETTLTVETAWADVPDDELFAIAEAAQHDIFGW